MAARAAGRLAEHFAGVLLGVPARRLVVTSGPKGDTMKQTHRQISRRVQAGGRRGRAGSPRGRAAREQAIIGFGYGTRG